MFKLEDINPLHKKGAQKITSIIRFIELLLAAIIVLAVVIGTANLVASSTQSMEELRKLFGYDEFQKFLSHLLLLIIALELAIMLVTHNLNIVVEVMIYAIARKMLIYNTAPLEMLLGAVTLVLLFALRVFLSAGLFFIKNKDKNKDEACE